LFENGLLYHSTNGNSIAKAKVCKPFAKAHKTRIANQPEEDVRAAQVSICFAAKGDFSVIECQHATNLMLCRNKSPSFALFPYFCQISAHKMNSEELLKACHVENGSLVNSSFQALLNAHYANSRIVIMVDENTHDCCLEYLITTFDQLAEAEVMLLPVGEENKVLEVCFQVWEALTEYGIGRNDLIINLGGGVVTDMGGFIAAVYKRGVDFINIPTSLLGMVDASIGGKTGIDLGKFKNQLGVFKEPIKIYTDLGFLNTLPNDEVLNGFAEMLKHALISSDAIWQDLKSISTIDGIKDFSRIQNSQIIKCIAVVNDPFDEGQRKTLNFGHTVGHALEGFYLDSLDLSHGHCVALGIAVEAHISFSKGLLGESEMNDIFAVIRTWYVIPAFDETAFDALIELMKNDKKNSSNKILGCALNGIGNCSWDVEYTHREIKDGLNYLLKLN
jgi:3-dehydroquinate synthase